MQVARRAQPFWQCTCGTADLSSHLTLPPEVFFAEDGPKYVEVVLFIT